MISKSKCIKLHFFLFVLATFIFFTTKDIINPSIKMQLPNGAGEGLTTPLEQYFVSMVLLILVGINHQFNNNVRAIFSIYVVCSYIVSIIENIN